MAVCLSDKLVFSAFNTLNKDNGFYQKQIDQIGDPELLSMGPFYIFTEDGQAGGFCALKPLKAVTQITG